MYDYRITIIMYMCIHTHVHTPPPHSEAVPPDVYRKKPMCMSQYPMYSKCRIPHPGVDRVRHTPISESKHVIVMRNGHVSLGYLTVLCVHDIHVTCTSRSSSNYVHVRLLSIMYMHCYTCYTCSFFAWMFFTSVQMGLWLWLPLLISLNSCTTLSRCPLTPPRVQLVS